MPAATRVVVVPPAAWDDERILAAARAIAAPAGPVHAGDDVGGLVVVGVEPAPGAQADARTAIDIETTPRASRGRLLDVAILLDASESMGLPWSERHTRWAAACEALRSFLRAPGATLRLVSLFIYAREAHLVAGPVAASDVKLPELTPRGRALTGSALNTALAYLASNAAADCEQCVLLLTDGAGEVAELERAAKRATRLRVPVHALVFSPEADAALARVAAATGGTAQVASSPPSFVLRYVPEESP